MEITLETIKERLDNLKSDNAQEHSSMLEQVKKINGSIADIQKFRYIATGSLLVLNALVLPIVIAVAIKFIMINLF